MAENVSNPPPPTPVLPDRDWVEIPTVQARRVVVEFLQKLFEASPNPALRWVPDSPKKSTILITDSFPTDQQEFGRRPVIVVSTSGAQILHSTIDTLEYESLTGDEKVYSELMSTTIVVTCVSSSELEAEHLGWLVGKYVWLLKNYLRRKGFFDLGRGIQMSPVTPIGQMVHDSVSTYRIVSVSFPAYFQQRHRVSPMLREWNKFDVEIGAVSTNAQGIRPHQVDMSGGSINYQSDTTKRRATENWDDVPPEPKTDQTVLTQKMSIEGEDQ